MKKVWNSTKVLALTAVALFATVFFLFREVLQPNYCLFSNDAPLGLVQSDAGRAATAELKTGYWADLNWVGSQPPSVTPCPSWLVYQFWHSTILNSKLHAPVALILMGLAAALVAKGLRVRTAACIVVGIAAALASNPVSYACWGLPGKALTLAMSLLAIYFINLQTHGFRAWLRFAAAGFAVGLGVMEGGDVGAILSIYVGCYTVWRVYADDSVGNSSPRRPLIRLLCGIGAGALVAMCAGWIASQSLFTLIGTQLQGSSLGAGTAESEAQKWDFATGWSMPLVEVWRIGIPGLFGYRMDTPGGGAYWGGVGPDGRHENRFSGSGEYVGMLVLMISAFAVVNVLRRDKSIFSPMERRMVWFWTVAGVVSLFLAFGRFTPLYYLVFKLPFLSNIRVPMKYLHAMNLSLWILFAFGLEAIGRTWFDRFAKSPVSVSSGFARWKKTATSFEQRWVFGTWLILGLTLLAAFTYTSSLPALQKYLAGIQFTGTQPATAYFSVGEVWESTAVLAAGVALVTWAAIGGLRASGVVVFWISLGSLLAVDLIRADRPWVKAYDYKARYQSNALFDLLRDRPWEHRVTAYLVPERAAPLVATTEFAYLHKEWLENQFQYYNIQSLDIDQMPRKPEAENVYLASFRPPELGYGAGLIAHLPELGNLAPEQAGEVKAAMPRARAGLFAVRRLWELTNTRYMLGWAKGIETLNDLVDPDLRRFKVKMPYTVQLKPGITPPAADASIADVVQAYTVAPNDAGPLALIEFTGALPRAKFYSKWEIITNRAEIMPRLLSPAFDPQESVILADPTTSKSTTGVGDGEVAFQEYAPKRLVLKSRSSSQGIVLLNDRWNEYWKAEVDHRPVPILTANYLMRAVEVGAGEHTIEFRFEPPVGTFSATVSAFAGAGLSVVILGFGRKPAEEVK